MGSLLAGLDVICAQFVVSSWTVVGLVLTGAAIYIWRRRARPHRALRALGCAVVAVLVVVGAIAVSVNAYFAYLPTVGDAVQSVTGDRQWMSASGLGHLTTQQAANAAKVGLVIRLPIPADPVHDFPRTTSVVYLPAQYFTEPDRRFPVVYLFHGSPGQPSDWFHAGDAASEGRTVAQLGAPAIIVAPRMSRSWTDDPECLDGAKEKVESHLLDDIIPTVDSHLRSENDRNGRVFAGMSAGGYCALNLALRNRALVATIIDLSGDTGPTHTGGAISLFGRTDPNAGRELVANSPDHYARDPEPEPADASMARQWQCRHRHRPTDVGTEPRARPQCQSVDLAGTPGRTHLLGLDRGHERSPALGVGHSDQRHQPLAPRPLNLDPPVSPARPVHGKTSDDTLAGCAAHWSGHVRSVAGPG